jgi:hypothetical protein
MQFVGWLIFALLAISTLGLSLLIGTVLWVSQRLRGRRMVSAAAYNDEDSPAAYRLKQQLSTVEEKALKKADAKISEGLRIATEDTNVS